MAPRSDPRQPGEQLPSEAADLAAEVADLAERCDVVPDAVVRSAKAVFAVRSAEWSSDEGDREPGEAEEASSANAESDPAEPGR
jgi:hypothetical protein